MTVKRVMLVILCLLLITVIVMTGIVVSQVGQLLQGILGLGASGTTTTGPKPSTSASTTQPTTAPTTQPTTPPTTQPTEPSTEPPTTAPTEPEHEHTYELTEAVKATCENYGYKIYTCTDCGKQDIPLEDQEEPYGHNYGAGKVVEPTCTENGYTRYTCSRCGGHDYRNTQNALGHNEVVDAAVAATCTEAGLTEGKHCDRCSEVMIPQETIDPTGHAGDPTGEVQESTCTEDGYIVHLCGACQTPYMVTTPATGHQFGEWVNEGNLVTRTCEICAAVESYELTITSNQVSVDDGTVKTYIICVGIDLEPQMCIYTIHDYLNNGTLTYTLDPVLGLVVTYTDSSGTVTIQRAFFDTTVIEIAAG